MVGKMKKISFLFVFLYFITLLFVVACSETGELPVAPVPEIPSITIPSTENTRLVFTSDGGGYPCFYCNNRMVCCYKDC